MKKLAIMALSVVALVAMTAVAVAQYPAPDAQVTGSVTPTKGGTKKKPKNGKVSINTTIPREANKTAERITFFVPQNVSLGGRGFRYCPYTQINDKGVASCKKGSKVGTGTATAFLGSKQLDFKVTIFAGSPKELALYLETDLLSLAIPGLIESADKPFGQKITVNIPKNVQQPVAGLYANVTQVGATIGPAMGVVKKTKRVKGKKRKVKVKVPFVRVSGCPASRAHSVGVRFDFIAKQSGEQPSFAEAANTVACTR